MSGKELDRREFVMGSIGFGMVVMAGGALAGCAAGASTGNAAADVGEGKAGETVEQSGAPSSASDMDAGQAGSTPALSGKALVVVFSYSGSTLTVAERVREATGADLFRVETTDAYPDEYSAMTAQVQREQDEGYLPPLAATVEDWESYDVVYLGAPVWWDQLPHVMRSFLTQHDLSGKTVAPFCTSGGSSIDGMADAIRAIAPGANLLEGLTLGRSSLPGALDRVQPWVEGLVAG